jgi:cystathionine beta-lyase/cystathionine gamma-synthase
MLNGAILAPFEAWLVLRGLRTLPVRLAQHETDAVAVGEFLRSHPAVARVFHPAFDDSPLRHSMRGYAGLLSFELRRGDAGTIGRVIDALRVFRIGVSWGGVESIVVSPNRGVNTAYLESQQIPAGLIRISVGLEGAGVLIEDLQHALTAAS